MLASLYMGFKKGVCGWGPLRGKGIQLAALGDALKLWRSTDRVGGFSCRGRKRGPVPSRRARPIWRAEGDGILRTVSTKMK